MSEITKGVQALVSITQAPTTEQLRALQDRMLSMGGDTEGPQVEHFFGDGLYGRFMEIPPGVLLVGKMHRKAGITVQLYGDCEYTTPGKAPERITGYKVWQSDAGAKRVIFAHEPTGWLALHATNETDMDKVEADLIVPEPQALEGES